MNLPESWDRLLELGATDAESPLERTRRRLLILLGITMSGGGILWGTLLACIDLWHAATIPYGYALLTTANLTFLARSRNVRATRLVQVGLSLILPFLLQWALGGFVAAGAVMLWAVLSIVSALVLHRPRHALGWLAAYVVLTIASGTMDARLAAHTPPSIAGMSSALFVINIGVVSTIVFFLAFVAFNERNQIILALTEANLSIQQLNGELSEQRLLAEAIEREAREASRAKSAFLANMSHELRTPLNAIVGYTELVTEEACLSDQTQRDLACVAEAGAHLQHMVSDILDLSKIEAGRMELDIHDMSSHAILREALAISAPLVAKNNNELRVHLGRDAHMVGDSYKLKQVVINLLSNAGKFSSHGVVQLSADIENGFLVVDVEDNGIGMTPTELEHVFDAFSQANDSTTRTFGGTGLGLTICKDFCELMHGQLDARSSVGKGSWFRVSVPVDLSGAS